MDTLIIKGNEPNSFLRADYKEKTIEIGRYAALELTEKKLQILSNWLSEYEKYSHEVLTFKNCLPVMPYESWRFYSNDKLSELKPSGFAELILAKLSVFNFIFEGSEEGGYFPTFEGSMTDNFFGISGVSCSSETILYYYVAYSWLEIYFQNIKPKNFTIEIKLDYYNTSSFKCIIDLIRGAIKYKEENNSIMNLKWFYDSIDPDWKDERSIIEKTLHEITISFIPVN